MKTYHKSCVFCALFCGALVCSSNASGNDREFSQKIRDKLYSCGVNSLYLFLNLHGHPADFKMLKSKVTIGEKGTSLYDLQNAAAIVGMPVETVHCSYSVLCSLNMPVIAWINKHPGESDESFIGHFIVLIKVDDDGVAYLDGTSGRQSTMQQANFIKQWNGMIVMKKEKTSFPSGRMALSVFLIGIASILLYWGFAPKKCVVFIFACLMLFPSLCPAETPTRIWRTRENESINALYLLLQTNGVPCDYGSLDSNLKQFSAIQSLDSIKNHARKNGLKLDVFRCTSPDALNRVPIPFLVHTEGGSDADDFAWKGNFLLIIGRGHGSYMTLDCGTIGISEVSEETLRRYWSGYVLGKPPRTKPSFFQTPTFFSLMLGLAVFLLYLGFVVKKKPNSFVANIICFMLLSVPASQAEEKQPDTIFTPEQVKEVLLETASNLESLKVCYHSEYYTAPQAPPKSYLYRKILMKSPYYLNHTNSHPCEYFSWDKDPMLQQAFIQGTIGYNTFPFHNSYFLMKLKPDDPLPGTLSGEFFINATGIWPMKERKTPTWGDVPCALRDIAQNIHYDQVRPFQEMVDGHWCHVLCWENNDTLWLDMGRGAALLARDVYHRETGALAFRYELSDHQEAAPGIWIPKKLRNIQFDFSAQTEEGRKRRVIDGFFVVEEIEVNTLAETDFDFTPLPGALLTYDAREPDAQYPYQSVSGGEEMLDRIADWIRTMYPLRETQPRIDWGWAVGLIVIPIILLLEVRKRIKNEK